MKIKIKDIASIRSGYHFDRKIIPDPEGSYRIIQMRDIDSRNMLDVSNLIRISTGRDVDRYLARKGDVLFVSRGSNNFAVVIDYDLKDAIPVSYFFIVRLKTDAVQPAYLAWYINQPGAQGYLGRNLKGSYIPMIGKEDFQQLPIEVPPLSLQKTIVELDFLKKREKELLCRLAEKKAQLIDLMCMKSIRGDGFTQ
jgi:restriction endonuclease S subunit